MASEMGPKQFIVRRAYVLYFMMCAVAVGVLGKVIYIQFVQGADLKNQAMQTTTKLKNIEAVRGNIYSHNGRLLATSVPIYEIAIDPQIPSNELFNAEVGALAKALAALYPGSFAAEYERKIREARADDKQYLVLRRNVSYADLQLIRQFPLLNKGRYKGGFICQQQNKRVKPFDVLAARTIGYERDGVQPVGLEGAYSTVLGGVSGQRLMQKMASGVWKPVSDDNEIDPKDGMDIVTTIDVNIQDVAESALMRQLEEHEAASGTVILMEVHTGRVRAIANLKRAKSGGYYEGYNYAIGESTEPGSTFKLASLLVALEDNVVELTDSVNTGNGTMRFYDRVMRDSKPGGYGKLSVEGVIAHSSNVGISRIIDQHYSRNPSQFIDGLKRLGLDQPLGVAIKGEGKPYIKTPRDSTWSGTTLPWMSIGYETQLAPIQILALYAAVANGGNIMRPVFVERVMDKGHLVEEIKPEVLRPNICSAATIEKARKALEATVRYGTGKSIRNEVYSIAGKTGTCQVGYGDPSKPVSYQASFAGYFPADDPVYACMVVVSAPSKDQYYASQVAAPIFKEVADKVYASAIEVHKTLVKQEIQAPTWIPYAKNGSQSELMSVYDALNIPYKSDAPEKDWVVTVTGEKEVSLYPRDIQPDRMPQVKGMAIQDALYLLENLGLRVEFSGVGVVLEQSILPGSQIETGQLVNLQLS